MENLSIWKMIKLGFWLGVGFIIPQLFVMYAGTAASVLILPSMMESSIEGIEESVNYNMGSLPSRHDYSTEIEIKDYREIKNGNQLLILGEIENTGETKLSSIQLEAELKDAEGQLVYECSEYINNALKPNEKENFQIKCGCGKNAIPEYSIVTVRVVNASNFY